MVSSSAWVRCGSSAIIVLNKSQIAAGTHSKANMIQLTQNQEVLASWHLPL